MKKNYRAPRIADEASHERGTATQVLRAEMINEKPIAATVDRDWMRAWEIVVSIVTFMFYLVLDTAKVALFVCSVVPAALINYEAMAGRSNAELAVAVMSAVFAAFSVVVVFSDRSRISASRKLFAAALALTTVSYNVRNAIGISAAGHQIAQDNFGHEVEDSGIIKGRITDAKNGLAEQIKAAGYDSVATYESKIRSLQTLGYKTARWEGIGSTEHCTLVHITTTDERELCRQINDLKLKKTAAQNRDRIKEDLEDLENNRPKPVRTRLDAEVANLGVFVGLFGYTLDDNGKKVLESGIDWQFGLIVEAIGSGGPELVLLLFMLFDPRETEKARRKKAEREAVRVARRAEREAERAEREREKEAERKEADRRKAEQAKPAPAPKPEVARPELKTEETDGSDPQITAFLNRNTTRVTGGRFPRPKLYKVWKDDCEDRGIKPGTSQAFSKRIERFVNCEFDEGAHRHYCVGIALKDRNAAPELRVVNGDARGKDTKVPGAKRWFFAL